MKIICIGLNYKAHNIEMKRSPGSSDDEPVLFMKPDTAILHNDENRFYIPDFSSDIHYEAEIVVKINKMGKNIAERFAHRYYDEITVGIDFTARDLQSGLKQKGLPWEISKAFDNAAAVGIFIRKEEFAKEINNISFRLDKNGETVQAGNTADMIHSVDKFIAYASRFFTLKTGDLLFTGTPSGVGPVKIGDKLNGYIEGKEVLSIEIC